MVQAQPDLVVPCDDRALVQLLSLPGHTALIERSLGRIACYPTLLARSDLICAARAAAIAAPKTFRLESENDLKDGLPRPAFPPC